MKEKAIICDLDGTLALLNGRDPYDASTCHLDEMNKELKHMIDLLMNVGYRLIISSGRAVEHLELTKEWLRLNGIIPHHIYMRFTESPESNILLKEQILLEMILPNYDVFLAFEDMYQVADMYRSHGIPCWQVNRDPWAKNSFTKEVTFLNI